MGKYDMSKDENDKIQSSVLFNYFKLKTHSTMRPDSFKEDMLNISGITFKKTKTSNYYPGFKEKPEMNEERED